MIKGCSYSIHSLVSRLSLCTHTHELHNVFKVEHGFPGTPSSSNPRLSYLLPFLFVEFALYMGSYTPGCSCAIFQARAWSLPPTRSSTASTSRFHVGFPNLSTCGEGGRKQSCTCTCSVMETLHGAANVQVQGAKIPESVSQ